MPLDYIRGIMRPDGRICVEYLVTGEEEPGQILIEEDISAMTDKEIIEYLRDKSPHFDDPDYSNIVINRDWFNHSWEKQV